MLNHYEIHIMQKDRQRQLAREWNLNALRWEAEQARRRTAQARQPSRRVLRQILLRTFTITLLIMLLALSLTRMARAADPVGNSSRPSDGGRAVNTYFTAIAPPGDHNLWHQP